MTMTYGETGTIVSKESTSLLQPDDIILLVTHIWPRNEKTVFQFRKMYERNNF